MHQKLLLDKISSVLAATEQSNAAKLLKLIDEAGRIFVGGAGRSGLVSRFFAMRLVHSGYQVNMVGEIVTPAIKAGDLFLVISGSGGTKTLLYKLVMMILLVLPKECLWALHLNYLH